MTIRLVYLAPADIQVPRVDRQCIVSFCSALQRLGVQVELVAIRIRVFAGEPRAADVLDLYRIRDRFRTRLVRVPVGQDSGQRWMEFARLAVHMLGAIAALLRTPRTDPLVLYTKTYSTLAVLARLRPLRPHTVLAFEPHMMPRTRKQRDTLRRADKIIANSHALARDLVTEGVVPQERVMGTHQGVDLQALRELRCSKQEARSRVRLPGDRKLVVYTGKIYIGYTEVEHILAAARALERREDLMFVLVGGRDDHVQYYRDRVRREARGNVRFVGFVVPTEIHDYQFAADLLLLYYPSGSGLNDYRSPGKLFDYMAVERPIIAVDLPVLHEVLGADSAAALVPPDAPERLAEEIERLIDDEPRCRALVAAAAERVKEFTWDRRAERVIEFIGAEAPPRATERRAASTDGHRRA